MLSWLRRFTAATALVRVVFTRLLVAVDPDPPLIGTADSPLADAVTAILACSRAIACRWEVSMVSPWSVVSAARHQGTFAQARPEGKPWHVGWRRPRGCVEAVDSGRWPAL